MRPETEALARHICEESLLDQFLLVGGTALSIHLEHRLSEDLDFAITDLVLPKDAISELLKHLEAKGCVIEDATPLAARHYFGNSGLDIENHQQDWLVDGIKLTFFTLEDENGGKKLAADPGIEWFKNLKYASLDTLFVTKSLLLTDRHALRDSYDMLTLMKQGRYTYADLVDAYITYRPGASLQIPKQRLLNTDYPLTDPGLEGLTDESEEEIIEKIHQFFARIINVYESNTGSQ